MSPTEDSGSRAQAQAAFQAFWKGDRKNCFVMERSTEYCDCDVFLAGLASRIGLIARVILIQISRCIPPCALKVAVLRLTGMQIGRDVYIAPGVVIDPLWPCLIELGDSVILGMGCRLLTHEYSAKQFRIGRIRIGDRSVIGAGATVRCGVTIGQRATVGCNSFVNTDVGADETVGGVPAKPLAGPEGKTA